MQRRSIAGFIGLVGLFSTAPTLPAQSNQPIYADSLGSGWTDWSWASVNFANASPVHGGTQSISATAGGWEAVFFHCAAPFDPAGYTNLSFWIHGGPAGGQLLLVQAVWGGDSVAAGVELPALPSGAWIQVNAPLSRLVPPGQAQIDGVWIQDVSGGPQPPFYVDDVVLHVGAPLPPVPNSTSTVAVDAAANRHPISPLIYGVAFATSNELAGLNFTLNRSGGNGESRYNWQLNAHNHAADWYFESIDDGSATPGAKADEHIAASRNGGAQPMLTLPMIGWVPKLGPGRSKLASYSIAKYGAQTGQDSSWMPDAGNGLAAATGQPILNNDPTDANFPTNAAFQQAFVQHLIGRWGNSTNGGVQYYFTDNEPGLWHETHRDIHPVGATMAEIRDKMFEYASLVKSNDPNAVVLGPEEWNYISYLNSGYDFQTQGQTDRNNHGGMDFMPWLLDQFRQHDTSTGQRLLDYFTLHCYPQSGEYLGGTAASLQALRNRSTRQLWDPHYVDESWMNAQIMLIPRMKNWVATYYPGTKIGVTEYSWGAESHINGATAQADVLGIFGREGLDLATYWTCPATNTPVYNAMKLYRNYDGHKATFGDISVAATVGNPDQLSAFAALRTPDRALTVLVVNKSFTGLTPLALSLTNFATSGTAQGWQLTAANALTRLPDVPYFGGVLTNSLPAQSVTLFVLPTVTHLGLRIGANAPAGQMELWLDGQAGQSYVLQSSPDLTHWSAVSTNTFASNSFRALVSTTGPARMFYRAQLQLP